MSTTTPNLGLVKPSGNERPSRSDYNGNMDILDEAVGKLTVSGLLTGINFNSWDGGNTCQITLFLNDNSRRMIRLNSSSIRFMMVDSGGTETTLWTK